MQAIDPALQRLAEIVELSKQHRSRSGYFAAMYRRVTQRIKDGIEQGVFDDGQRMSHFGAVFADFYFAAFDGFRQQSQISQAWQLTFRTAASDKPLILQHLLLGMNAHIHLDLGIAAATVAPGSDYATLEADFRRINDLLFEELDPTENRVGQLSPWLALVDRCLGSWDERLGEFALGLLRESAWEFGRRLSALEANRWGSAIVARDHLVTQVARELVPNSWLWRALSAVVRQRESTDIAHNITVIG